MQLNLNLFSALSWTWRVLRGHSVTFAGIFALALLGGVSVIGKSRELLSQLGAPWYAWLLVPILGVAFLAKKETEWLPDAAERRKWARRVFFGSIAIAVAVALGERVL